MLMISLAGATLCFAARGTTAQTAEACTGIDSDAERLACYDAAHGRPAKMPPESAPEGALFEDTSAPVSMISGRWELPRAAKTGPFRTLPYKPVVLLPVFYPQGHLRRSRDFPGRVVLSIDRKGEGLGSSLAGRHGAPIAVHRDHASVLRFATRTRRIGTAGAASAGRARRRIRFDETQPPTTPAREESELVLPQKGE